MNFGNIIRSILDTGAVAILPIMITLIGIAFRMKFLQALKSGLMIGIGFQGLRLVISLLSTTIAPITGYYIEQGSGFTTTDVGWQTLSAAAWLAPFAALVIPTGLLINFLMVKYGKTKTLNVDIWNYWHILFAGAICYFVLRENFGFSLQVAFVVGYLYSVFLVILTNIVADFIAPYWQRYFGLEGTTCTTINYTSTILPVTWFFNKVVEAIPGLNKIEISLDWVNKKFGSFGDPTIIGFLVGILLALITRQTLAITIQVGVGIAAVIVIMPRMASLLMEGLTPISKSARNYMVTKIGEDKELLIGMDIALGLGDPTTITTSLIFIPICVLLAFILPGNQYFPVGIFGSLGYFAAICSMTTRGNLFRSIIVGTMMLAFVMVSMNFMADITTTVVTSLGVMEVAEGASVTASSVVNFVDMIIALIAKLFG